MLQRTLDIWQWCQKWRKSAKSRKILRRSTPAKKLFTRTRRCLDQMEYYYVTQRLRRLDGMSWKDWQSWYMRQKERLLSNLTLSRTKVLRSQTMNSMFRITLILALSVGRNLSTHDSISFHQSIERTYQSQWSHTDLMMSFFFASNVSLNLSDSNIKWKSALLNNTTLLFQKSANTSSSISTSLQWKRSLTLS